jgi:hypothetical protein
MRVNSESVSNEIDESDSQYEKHDEQRIWIWRGIITPLITVDICQLFPKRMKFLCRSQSSFELLRVKMKRRWICSDSSEVKGDCANWLRIERAIHWLRHHEQSTSFLSPFCCGRDLQHQEHFGKSSPSETKFKCDGVRREVCDELSGTRSQLLGHIWCTFRNRIVESRSRDVKADPFVAYRNSGSNWRRQAESDWLVRWIAWHRHWSLGLYAEHSKIGGDAAMPSESCRTMLHQFDFPTVMVYWCISTEEHTNMIGHCGCSSFIWDWRRILASIQSLSSKYMGGRRPSVLLPAAGGRRWIPGETFRSIGQRGDDAVSQPPHDSLWGNFSGLPEADFRRLLRAGNSAEELRVLSGINE